MTLVCDEFGSFIGSMDKYNANGASAADRAIYLKAYDRRPHKADRIQRKTQFVPMLSLGILAGVQPDRLPAFGDLVSDGLLQRFVQIVVQPMKFAPDDGSGGGRDCVAYGDLVDSLIKIEPKMNLSWPEGRVEPIEMMWDGYSAMENVRFRLHNLNREGSVISATFQAFVGKLPRVAGSLALILHLAEHRGSGNLVSVSAETIRKVEKIIFKFIIPHAIAIESRGNDNKDVQHVCSWILAQGKTTLRLRDFRRGPFRRMGDPNREERILRYLEGVEWLVPTGGARSNPKENKTWSVPQRIFDQFARRAEEERLRRQEVGRLIKLSAQRRGESLDAQ